MNDHEAMEAINVVLDGWLNLDMTAVEALHKIARISRAYQKEVKA
jgi:hypothetical protein